MCPLCQSHRLCHSPLRVTQHKPITHASNRSSASKERVRLADRHITGHEKVPHSGAGGSNAFVEQETVWMTWSHEAALLGFPPGPRGSLLSPDPAPLPLCCSQRPCPAGPLLTASRSVYETSLRRACLSPRLRTLHPRWVAPARVSGEAVPASGPEGALRIPVSCAPALTRHRTRRSLSCVSPFAAMTARRPPGKESWGSSASCFASLSPVSSARPSQAPPAVRRL